jgi:hypothetical protein
MLLFLAGKHLASQLLIELLEWRPVWRCFTHSNCESRLVKIIVHPLCLALS